MDDMTISLAGPWRLRNCGSRGLPAGVGPVDVPVQIPGDNCSALQSAGVLPDPYWRDNEKRVQWVADADWSFSRAFELPESALAARSAFLSFDSVDTVAKVFVNGRKGGETDDQFRRWRFDVGKLLRPGKNEVEVRIVSPRRAAREIAAAERPEVAPAAINDGTVPGINYLRKCQCSAGWDWGVSLPVSGIYGDVSLVMADSALLDSLWTVQDFAPDGSCRVSATVRLEPVADVPAGTPVAVEVEFDGETRVLRGRIPRAPGAFELTAAFTVAEPRLWWPAGYGEQPLYPLRARLGGQEISRRIGLRRVEIDDKPDKDGIPLVIRVNGVPVFAKGADWIPCDARPLHETPEKKRHLLESAVAANMNVVRVWGGGHFESDGFYDACDELGLLVWHDMMFACMRYPAHPAFLARVRAETLYQVRRLRDHACIALWCGDNECLASLYWNPVPPAERENKLVLWDRLCQAVGEAVREADPTRLFWPSSPCVGPGDYRHNVTNLGGGDTHYWAVWQGGAKFGGYYVHKPRFCSEFGFQSFPSRETVETYASRELGDFNLFSPVVDHHQKCPSGNSIILGMFGNYFRMPDGFERTIWLSQVQQAVAIRTGVEYWRSMRPWCMGTVFWQLDDNWPVASWSSIEFGGRWKALHYAARRFFAPLAAFAFAPGDDAPFRATLVWDLPQSIDAQVSATLRKVSDGTEAARWTFRRKAKGAGAFPLALPDLAHDAKARAGLAPEECFLELRTAGTTAGGTVYGHSETVFLAPWKRCELPVSGLSVGSVSPAKDAPGAFDVELRARAPAFFAWLSVAGDPEGRFDDNLVTVLPGATTLRYTPGRGAKFTAASLRRALSAMDLRATYE